MDRLTYWLRCHRLRFMVSETICCPHCGKAEAVVRHGYNRGSTARCCCKQCDKTFTPKPNPRTVTPEKWQAILDAGCGLLCRAIPVRRWPSSSGIASGTRSKNFGPDCPTPGGAVLCTPTATGHTLRSFGRGSTALAKSSTAGQPRLRGSTTVCAIATIEWYVAARRGRATWACCKSV